MPGGKDDNSLMKKGMKDLMIKFEIGAGPKKPTNPLKGKKYTVDKSGVVQFKAGGGMIKSKYYEQGGEVMGGREMLTDKQRNLPEMLQKKIIQSKKKKMK